MLKDFLNYLWLVDEADDSYLSMAFRAGQGVCFIDVSDKVGHILPHYMHPMQFSLTPSTPNRSSVSSFLEKILPKRVSESVNNYPVSFSLNYHTAACRR